MMDAVKAEKETAMRRYRRIQSAWRLLRWLLEACAAALLLSWSSAHLPAAARAAGDLLRAAVAAALTPRFGFFLANVIVAVLFAKSRSLTSSSSSSTSSTSPPFESNIYEEFLETRGRVCYALAAPEAEAVADKEVVYEEKKVPTETKSCRRSRSEKLPKRRKDSPGPEFRRSATDVAKKIAGEEKKDEEEEEEWEGMGEEEFRRTVEAFIAKQLRFQREESMAVVCSSGGPPEPGAQKT